MDKRFYLVILADIIGSRSIVDRHSVQKQLEKVLKTINNTYNDALASQFIITLGDEFQGVLNTGVPAMKIIDKIQCQMHPIKLRFGVGVGSLSIPLKKVTSLGSDGPAFHLAREMISQVKKLETKKLEPKTSLLIGIEGRPDTTRILNSTLKLVSAIQGGWTERQRQVMAMLEEDHPTQTAAAKRLDITQSSVQKSLVSSQFYLYKDALESLAHTLDAVIQHTFA